MRSGDLPITGGVRPHVTVTVGTLTRQPGSPATQYQFGAASSTEWARRIARDATIARIVFGPDGQILNAGRSTRTFTTAQLRAILARDHHCIRRGRDAPPGRCDAHHKIHWADRGHTDIDNGVLLCRRHHDRVHTGHPHRAGP